MPCTIPHNVRGTCETAMLCCFILCMVGMVRVCPWLRYVLSVVYKGKPTHHKVVKGDDGTFSVNNKLVHHKL